MTNGQKLVDSLSHVDWSGNVSSFCADDSIVDSMAESNFRLAIWSKQFEQIEKDNPALCFIREMQVAGHLVATSTALAVYKAAAASTRTVLESALYYTYFRTHPSELATLVRDDKWYMSKSEIIQYHVTHTPDFNEVQKKLPVVSLVNPWYSKISAIVHGQIPGVWVTQKSIKDTKPDAALQQIVVSNFTEGVDIVHRLFLCTVGRELWDYFSPPAKKTLLHGLSGDIKTTLGIDSA